MASFFDVSLETANQFYIWGWRASLVGAVLTAVSLIFLFMGTRVRDKEFETNIADSKQQTAQLNVRAAELETNVADSKKETALLNLKAAELEQQNLTLRAQIAPKFFKDQTGVAQRLSQFEGMRTVIFSSSDARSVDLAQQIFFALTRAKWNVNPVILAPVTQPGVRTSVAPYGPKGWYAQDQPTFKNAENSLVDELNNSDVCACADAQISPETSFRGIVIQVGPNPSQDEAELMNIRSKMAFENIRNIPKIERNTLLQREMELNTKMGGQPGVRQVSGGIISPDLYPPQ